MKEYSDIENDTFNVCNMSAATNAISAIAKSYEYEAQHLAPPTHPSREKKTNQLVKIGIVKTTSRNGTKQFKRQEFCITTRSEKAAESVIK